MQAWDDVQSLEKVRDDLKGLKVFKNRPGKIKSVFHFLSTMGYSWKLMLREKEMITFTLLQWASVAIGYYLFVMMLYWIQPEVWESTEDSDEGSIADLVLLLWIFVCIGVATLPLGIFSSCMAVVHFLHAEGKPSTIAACFKVVLPNTWLIWVFHWMDGWITIRRIIERLPKGDDDTPVKEKILGEILYYTWKVATMGILPNLITGRGIKDTALNTIDMVKKHVMEMLWIRIGYSILCWIIGVGTYIWGLFNYSWISERFFPGELEDTIADFYLFAGVPMLIAVAVIQLFIRPAYVIALSDVYVRYMAKKGEPVLDSDPPKPAISAFVAFGALCFGMLVVYLYRYEFGIMDMLATPYGQSY